MGPKRIQNEVWVLENQHHHGVLRWNRAWCLRSAMVIACRQSSSNSIEPNPKRNQQDFSVCRRETLQAEDHDFNLSWDDDNIHQRRPTRLNLQICRDSTTVGMVLDFWWERQGSFLVDGSLVWAAWWLSPVRARLQAAASCRFLRVYKTLVLASIFLFFFNSHGNFIKI